MLFIDNQTDITLPADLLERIAASQTHRDIELMIVDEKTIHTLNHTHRDIDRATDVLSFPLEGDLPHQPLGTVVISADHARAAAGQLGHPVEAEIALLFVHGLLHLMGYDHETDAGQMRDKEEEILAHFQLPKSLIVRTEGPHE